MDIQSKKTFLLQGATLYAEMIGLTKNDVIQRYLAFRIIVNAMSFEDIIAKRQHPRMREIRNVLLAHKQESDFFEGFRAADDISRVTITPLLNFMTIDTGTLDPNWILPELVGGEPQTKFKSLVPHIFDQYETDFLAGNRLINNFLCFTGSSVHEISGGDLPGAFYRYHSSKALFELSQYIFNNAVQDTDLLWLARHAKLDMLLHAQNMADCAIKDTRNGHSINGVLEVMLSEPIGDPAALLSLINDQVYQSMYMRVRSVRNKLIGHMDKSTSLEDLLVNLDALPVTDIYDLVNMIDKAIYTVAQSHIAIRVRYSSGNQALNNPTIIGITGLQTKPYG